MKTLNLKEYKYLIMILALLVSAFIVITDKLYYENEKKNTRIEKYNELKAIADLKTNEIVQWHNERLSEANFFSKHEMMVEETYSLINGNKKSAKILQKSLIHLVDGKRYENIFILNTKGDIIFSLDSIFSNLDSTTINLNQKVQNTHKIVFSDFYKCSYHKSIHFDIIAPFIDNKNNVFATLIFRVNPNDYLYPIIQNWPTPSKSSETLIVRSDGDSVLFLNELRHIKETALRLKMPTSLENLPANKAILGRTGIFEGIDYRNINVISDLRSIPGTNWYMVAKIDKDEIFKELYKEAIFITVLTLLIILFLVTFLTWIYNSRQKNMYKKLLANEIELHESQEEFRTTLYSIGDGVITTDNKGLIKHLNGIAENLTGWTEREAKGKKLEEVFHIINEDTRGIVENPVEKVLKEGLIVGLANHTLLISKDGKELPIADSGAPIKDVNGNITGVVLVFRDQTESRFQQKILKESEERFQLLFNKAPLGYQSLDFDGNFIDVNQQWLDTLGYNRDEVIGKWFGDYLVPEFRDAFRERFPIFKAQGYIHSEFEMLHKNGNKLFIAFEGKIGYNKFGEFIQTHCILQDITEKKKAENSLLLLSNRQEALLNTIPEIVMEVDTNKVYKWANKRGFEFFGYDVIGHGADEYFEGEQSTYKLVEPLFYSNENIVYVESWQRNKDGKKRLLAWYCTSIRDEKGNITGALSSARDITETKLIEEKLKDSYALMRIAGEKVKLGGWNVILNENRSYWSDQVAAIHEMPVGYSPLLNEEINFYAPEWRDKITEVFSRCAQEGITYDEEMEIITASGKRVWVRTVGEAVRDENGKIFKVQGAFQDISERKNIEAQLNESELLFKALMYNSPIYIFFKDRDIKSMHLSKNYEQMLGKPLSELIGKDMYDLFPSELAKKMIEDDKKIVEEGKMVVVDEELNDHYYTTIKFPILQENNKPLLAGFTIDITDRKKVEQELVKLNEELEQRIKERTQDLENKNSELERMNKAFIGREMRIKELKDKINQIESSNREN